MRTFRSKFDQSFKNIIEKFGFSVNQLSENEVALLKDRFALIVYSDRDGVGVNYLWVNNQGFSLQYPIGEILHLLNREWVPCKNDDRIDAELQAYALTLNQSANDILSGDNSWMKEVDFKPFPVSQPLHDLIFDL